MADIRHYMNGTLVNPRDFDKATITMDWEGKKEAANITINSITLVAEEGKILKDRILSGLTGGVGFFEGEPYTIQVGDLSNSHTFEGYLDFTTGVRFIDKCEVECSLKREQGTDWLNDVADGFSFRYLEDQNIITSSDFVAVPYVINYVPDGTQLIMLSISTFMVSKELVENIQSLAETISDVINGVIPATGASVGVGAGAVTTWDAGDWVMYALNIAARIAYIVAIVISLVKLIEQIVEQLMPPKRYHLGMPVRLLFQRACEHLGMNLQSTLLDSIDTGSNKWVVIPSKGHWGGKKPTGAANSWRETGVPSANDPIDTFGGVIRTFKELFNADFQIQNGTFIFERRDYFQKTSGYVIPDTFIDQENMYDVNTFNSDEIKSTYNINWSTDSLDMNTLDNQEGRIFQANLSPKVTNDIKLKSLTGLKEVAVPFCMSVRKDKLTFVEEVVKGLVMAADQLTGQLGNPQSLSGKIGSRIGALLTSSHYSSLARMVVMAGSSLQKNQRTILSAKNLWDNYHYINSFKEIDGKHNQYWIYQDQKIPFCFEDFITLLDNNQVETQSGEPAEIMSLEWEIWNNYATISYKINRLYDDNFNLTTSG